MRRELLPGPDDLLCERCGYLLNSLPPDGACPECGLPVAESTVDSPRRPPPWEAGKDHGPARFQRTAIAILLHPRDFFRHMTAQGDIGRSARFAQIALLPGLLFNSKTVLMHFFIFNWLNPQYSSFPTHGFIPWALLVVPIAVVGFWAGMYGAVVRLTILEAAYWGMRLPRDVVRRGLHYSAIQVTAASVPPWLVCLTYLCMVIANEDNSQYATVYLYALSLAVVASAVYLFMMYATAMRSLRYANR